MTVIPTSFSFVHKSIYSAKTGDLNERNGGPDYHMWNVLFIFKNYVCFAQKSKLVSLQKVVCKPNVLGGRKLIKTTDWNYLSSSTTRGS